MTRNARCLGLRLVFLALAANWLTGCATGGSEPRVVPACPPLPKYGAAYQARAAEEPAQLSEGSTIAEMLKD